jgi:putative methyltransferase (TIGR04325 family)
MSELIRVLKLFVPPIIIKLVKIRRRYWAWYGNYDSWSMAVKNSSGYASSFILNKKIAALSKVKNNTLIFELDAILYDKPIYNFQLFYAISYAANETEHKLTIIDFGGSLGSAYYWVKNYMNIKVPFDWYIIEQPHIVEEGKKRFEHENLKFVNNFNEYKYLNVPKPTIFLASGVLQCIENIDFIFDEISSTKYKFVIIDRTPFFNNEIEQDQITIQYVPQEYYGQKVSLPVRIFNQEKFINALCDYNLLINSASFDCLEYNLDGKFFSYRFMFFVRK